MPRFAIRYPYLIVVLCLITCVMGVTSLVRLPVDLFPAIRIPVVVVATFYSGMPPEQIENDITGRFERFFTLGSGIDHIESRSLPGVSLIKVFFQPGTDPDSAVTTIANLAAANLRRLPPGTLPPVVLKFDSSSLPVCLITLKGEGMNEAQLRDLGQYDVRNQVANVPGASVPQPFGGRYRQIMVYVDPLKLEAYHLSVMDVVRKVNDSNLILPAGDVRIGPFDYNIYANSQLNDVEEINQLPLRTVNNASVLVADVGQARDASQIQYSMVRVDGQPSVYLPVLKQGGSTISVVKGIKHAVSHLLDVPDRLITKVVFDQSIFVKNAIKNLVSIGAIGLLLTAGLILVFFGNLRATLAVLLSIPLSVLATFIALSLSDNTMNTMILGGLALAFSRLINNSVVVLENIFRHLEMGEPPEMAAEKGGDEVALPVLAATLATAVVFFPVIFLYGVSKFLFSALAVVVVLSLAASYLIAMTVVPLFCAKLIRLDQATSEKNGRPDARSWTGRFRMCFNAGFNRFLRKYERMLDGCLARPRATVWGVLGACGLSLGLYPFTGVSYFPKTDPGQFVINVKAPTGTRLEETEKLVQQVEDIIRQEVPPDELDVVLSNIGVTPGFSSIYTSNSAEHTATVQASLKPGHRTSSYKYIERVRRRLRRELPQLNAYFQSGGLVDAIINQGFPSPLDIQVSGSNLEEAHRVARQIAQKVRAGRGVSDVLVPQDVDYPALQLDVDRLRASELGLTSKEVVQNVITALTSDQMIAPSYWVDPNSGNDYMLTVQYPENFVKTLADLTAIPLRGSSRRLSTRLDAVSSIRHIESPTEVDHYQLRRIIDVYVSPVGEDLGRLTKAVEKIIARTSLPDGIRVNLRGVVQGMRVSFSSFGFGLILAVLLVYLILLAQFRSFIDPLLILLAVPAGLAGVLVILFLTGTTLNVMSLMGVVMVVGIVVSNSILILEFIQRLRADGVTVRQAVREACRVRMRPVLITSLATLVGLLPMAAKLGTGSEAYAPLALAIIGGLTVSVVLTVFIVPAAYLLVYGRAGVQSPQNRSGERNSDMKMNNLTCWLLILSLAAVFSGYAAADTNTVPVLTLQEAQMLAVRNHPQIAAANYRALAAEEVVKETRAGYFPAANLYATAAGAGSDNTRIMAGGLNNPSVMDRAAGGLAVSQLITDFGHTANLTASSRFQAQAENQNANATREQVLLQVDSGYFGALEAQAVLRVAEQTFDTRQLLRDQVTALATNKLRSELDVSFAQVALEEGRLLLQRAQNNADAAMASLSTALGYHEFHQFQLVEQSLPASTATNDVSGLIQTALSERPELLSLRDERDAAARYAKSQRDARLPTIAAVGVAGDAPTHDSRLPDSYAAGGVQLSLPLFAGGLYLSRQHEAELKAQVDAEMLRTAEDNVIRDVRIAWLNVNNALEQLRTTGQLLKHAAEAYDLAEARYTTGISSIVELSQAQLSLTSAQIANTNARYDLLIQQANLAYQTGMLQ